jgi:hypothetical protein
VSQAPVRVDNQPLRECQVGTALVSSVLGRLTAGRGNSRRASTRRREMTIGDAMGRCRVGLARPAVSPAGCGRPARNSMTWITLDRYAHGAAPLQRHAAATVGRILAAGEVW